MFYTRVMIMRQVIDHFVCSKGVTGKNDMFIAFFLGKRKVCVYIFIRIREILILEVMMEKIEMTPEQQLAFDGFIDVMVHSKNE